MIDHRLKYGAISQYEAVHGNGLIFDRGGSYRDDGYPSVFFDNY
jgi:hypothetical protein